MGLIKAKDFNVNICQSPEWYRADIFPEDFKKNVIVPAYQNHIAWLEPQDNLQRATNGFKSLLNFMNGKDQTQHWNRFVKEINLLDELRGENFWTTFTELLPLRYYDPTTA